MPRVKKLEVYQPRSPRTVTCKRVRYRGLMVPLRLIDWPRRNRYANHEVDYTYEVDW